MRIGYIRPHRRATTRAQVEALEDYKIAERAIYIEGREGETVQEAIKALRKGGALVVMHLWLLAPDRKSTRDSPRREMVRRVREVEAKGAHVIEASTGRSTSTDDRDCIILDNIDWLSGKSKGVRSKENGALGGRPPKEFTEDQMEQARQVWFDIRFKSWKEAGQHLPKGFTVKRAYEKWGPRRG